MNVALIEFGGSHDETIYSQMKFLRQAGHRIVFIYNKKLSGRIPESAFEKGLEINVSNNSLIRNFEFRNVRKTLVSCKVDAVVFNTLENKNCLRFLRQKNIHSMPITGVLHNVHKKDLLEGLGVSHYLVLSETLNHSLERQLEPGEKSNFFYPIFSPKIEHNTLLNKPYGEIWICIPGQVETKRRDYHQLLDEIERERIPTNIKFILLGKSHHSEGAGPELEKRINALGLNNQFTLFKEYVPPGVYDQYMINCDVVLPLIHEGNMDFSLYQRTKVSGAFNLALGYKKPMLLDKGFINHIDLKKVALFYQKSELAETLINLKIDAFRDLRSAFEDTRWSFKTNADRYLSQITQSNIQ